MSGFQGLTLSLQKRHGELVGDVRMRLMGHVAAVLDDMQLGVVQAREQAQPDSERHHPVLATPHQQGRHSYVS
jgi:hypothetical protein